MSDPEPESPAKLPQESALSSWAKFAQEREARKAALATAHENAGTGFWRLVLVVVVGILLAQGIAAAALWLLREVVMGPGALR